MRNRQAIIDEIARVAIESAKVYENDKRAIITHEDLPIEAWIWINKNIDQFWKLVEATHDDFYATRKQVEKLYTAR